MDSVTVAELVDLADCLAHDLLKLADDKQIPAKDLLMAVAMSQKIIQKILYQGDLEAVSVVLHEAEATFIAASEVLEIN